MKFWDTCIEYECLFLYGQTNNTMKQFFWKISDFRNRSRWSKCLILLLIIWICSIVCRVSAKTEKSIWWLFFFCWLLWWIGCFIKMLSVIAKASQKQEKNMMSDAKFQETADAISQTLKDWTHPELKVNFVLNKWEKALICFSVWIYKEKTSTKRINYWWLRYRVKIAKWLSYNVWSISPQMEKTTTRYLDDEWKLYVTDKRIIYMSDKKTESINLDKILNYEMIKDWVKIYRNTWTTREYWFLWDWRLFSVYMENLLNN